MGRGPIPMRRPKLPFLESITDTSTFGISPSFLGLSQSSGQVTHVLLTRSRLCPRPKPGSSLHLHVLGTPPAFVLSQDQTLREELPQRVVRKYNPRLVPQPMAVAVGRSAYGRGQATGQSRVRPWWDRTLAPPTPPARPEARSPMYTVGSGRKTGSILAPSSDQPRRVVRATASNLDTLLDRGSVEGCACC